MNRKLSKGPHLLVIVGALLLVCGSAVAQDDLTEKVNSGWAALQQGNLAEARTAFQEVLDASPTYDFGWYALGQVATREGKFEEAIAHFKKATELNAEKFEYQYGLAAAYRSREEYAKAIATLNNAELLATDPQTTYYLHLERGISYLSIRQYDKAIPDLQKAAEIQPGEKMAEQRLGMALYGAEDYGPAAQHLTKAAVKDARDYTTQIYLARSLINLGQREPDDTKKGTYYAQAVKAAQAAQTAKKGFEASNVLARAYLGVGNYNQAAQSFQAVVKSKPDYCAARVNLGQSYIGMESWDPAVQALEQAAECNPRSTTTLNLLAFGYMKQTEREKALAAYEKSFGMKADPKVAGHIKLVQENIRISQENAVIDEFNTEQQQAREAEKATFAAQMKEYEDEQKRRKQYEEDDN